jgi:lipopolysaccharide transport system permease protein
VRGLSTYTDLVRYRELFATLFRRDLHARYKGTGLGVLWSFVNPLLLVGIYLLVFSLLWEVVAVDHPGLFLLSGIALWAFFATTLQTASRSLLENANLIRKTRFPRQLVPLASVAAQCVGFAVMFGVLLVVNFAVLPRVRVTEWVAVPLALAFVALVAGLALAIACATVAFRDVDHLLGTLLLPWFFLTPVLYTAESLPGATGRYEPLVDVLSYVNFVAPPIDAIRDPLFFGELPQPVDVVYLVVAAVCSLALGAFVFSRVDDRIAVEL